MRKPEVSKESITGVRESNKETSLDVEEKEFELFTEQIIRETLTYGN